MMGEVKFFSYQQYDGAKSDAFPDGRMGYFPVLPVSLVFGGHRISCDAIVDSGADYCTFPFKFMAELGIEKLAKKDSNFHSALGSGSIFFCEVTIELGFTDSYAAYVGFPEGEHGAVNGSEMRLLGQVGFFDRFKVCFDWSTKCFGIETPLKILKMEYRTASRADC